MKSTSGVGDSPAVGRADKVIVVDGVARNTGRSFDEQQVARGPSTVAVKVDHHGATKVETAWCAAGDRLQTLVTNEVAAIDLVYGIGCEQADPTSAIVKVQIYAVPRQQVADLGVIVGNARHDNHLRPNSVGEATKSRY
jgi:hypothetical protein